MVATCFGHAKVRLDCLVFPPVLTKSGRESHCLRPLEERNVKRLVRVFELERVKRDVPEHAIAALVPRTIRERYFSHVVPSQGADSQVSLPTGSQLQCLYGQHRVEAARRVLPVTEQWWVLDLFDEEDTSYEQCIEIANKYENAARFSDGFIFYNLRKHSKNAEENAYWLARLSETKQRDYKQLCSTSNVILLNALDGLLLFPGLWNQFMLGTLHRLLHLKCLAVCAAENIVVLVELTAMEELSNYLQVVRDTWEHATLKQCELYDKVDGRTVEALQLLCPRYSKFDQRKIESLFSSRVVFDGVQDDATRALIRLAVLRVQWRIPSLFSFLEDSKYIEPCASLLRGLLPKRLPRAFQVRDQLSRHYAGSKFQEHYCELWIFTIRYFSQLSQFVPRRDLGRPKPLIRAESKNRRREFYELAKSLGFHSEQLERFNLTEVKRDLVRALVLEFTPTIGSLEEISLTDQILTLLGTSKSTSFRNTCPLPDLSNDYVDLSLERRCGRPFETDYLCVQKYLSWTNISCIDDGEPKEFVSPFSVARDILRTFHGISQEGSSSEESVSNSNIGVTQETAGEGNIGVRGASTRDGDISANGQSTDNSNIGLSVESLNDSDMRVREDSMSDNDMGMHEDPMGDSDMDVREELRGENNTVADEETAHALVPVAAPIDLPLDAPILFDVSQRPPKRHLSVEGPFEPSQLTRRGSFYIPGNRHKKHKAIHGPKGQHNWAIESFISSCNSAGALWLFDCGIRTLYEISDFDAKLSTYLSAWRQKGLTIWILDQLAHWRNLSVYDERRCIVQAGKVAFLCKGGPPHLWREVLVFFQKQTEGNITASCFEADSDHTVTLLRRLEGQLALCSYEVLEHAESFARVPVVQVASVEDLYSEEL